MVSDVVRGRRCTPSNAKLQLAYAISVQLSIDKWTATSDRGSGYPSRRAIPMVALLLTLTLTAYYSRHVPSQSTASHFQPRVLCLSPDQSAFPLLLHKALHNPPSLVRSMRTVPRSADLLSLRLAMLPIDVTLAIPQC